MSLSWDLLEDRRRRLERERRWRSVRMAMLAWSLAWFGVALCCVVFAWAFYGFFNP